MENRKEFEAELASLLNKYSMENYWDMPDFLMASMVTNFITECGHTMKSNLDWHGADSVCHPKQEENI